MSTEPSPFPPASRDDWLKRVDAVLKGGDFTDKLVKETADGIAIEPLYGPAEGPRAARPENGPWTILARMDHAMAARANAQAREDLANGVNGLVLVTADSAGARGGGLTAGDLPAALEGIPLHATSLRLEGNRAAAESLARIIDGQPLDPARLAVSFGLDDAAAVKPLAAMGFKGPFLEADGRPFHEHGASEAEELGLTLARAVYFLRQLEGLDGEEQAAAIGITLAADQDMFLTLAKFRSARLLWSRVLEVSGLPPAPLRLHGETSWRMMATLDPHTNILRATTAVFGAGLGGASSFTVQPFSQAQGMPNGFARRVARNVQTVLLEESNLWRVDDPAAGSGYVEHLTEELCAKAWLVFQNMERGIRPAIQTASSRSLPVVGTTAYRLKDEYKPEVEAR
jgi:methylmalonyl-CoA mutase